MLKLLCMLSLGVATSTARSQSIIQLTEQLALDAEKLASIKGTLQEMYQGYEDLQKGYTHIRDVVKDNFNLHEAFLDALWVVSPAVRGDPRLTEIVDLEYRLVTACRTAAGRTNANPVWTAQELDYIIGTFQLLLQSSIQVVEELAMITTDNELRMSDAQRLDGLDRIAREIKGQLAFIERFDDELSMEEARRNQEYNDINTLKSFYGLPN